MATDKLSPKNSNSIVSQLSLVAKKIMGDSDHEYPPWVANIYQWIAEKNVAQRATGRQTWFSIFFYFNFWDCRHGRNSAKIIRVLHYKGCWPHFVMIQNYDYVLS